MSPTPSRATIMRVACPLQQRSKSTSYFSAVASALNTYLFKQRFSRPPTTALPLPSATSTSHISIHRHALRRHRAFFYYAKVLQRCHYATTSSSSSNNSSSGSGSSSSASHHHSSDARGSGNGAAGQNSSNASGTVTHGNGSGGGSSGSGSAANKRSTTSQARKKMVKKGKATRRIKRQRGSARPTRAHASSFAAAGSSNGSTGSSSSSSGTGFTSAQSSGSGGGGGPNSSSHASRRSPSACARAAARRRLNKSRTAATTSPSSPSSSANSGPMSNAAAAVTRAKRNSTNNVIRKGLLPRKSSPAGRAGSGHTTGNRSSGASSSSSSSSRTSSPGKALSRSNKKQKKIRICVLTSSYDGADSATASVDNYWCTPQHYVSKDRQKYTFADVAMKKIDSYRTVRELVTSNKYDVFFNLCDGGRDEKRAGVDVVEALEEHNAAFTGTDSRSFEPSKIDMKLMVGSSGVKVPNFVLLDNEESLAKKCRHLKFPVIVKHLSGYASVGINKDNRCDNLDQLKLKVRAFIKEYNHALIEEFIRGREGTVLACADPGSPFGVKVFKPLMFNFLQSSDDFAYFEKKWTMECNEQAYGFLPTSDPAYTAIIEMARNAFRYIMNGVGYGRADFRIDDQTGVPYFLEINPNCGMWYAPKDGGDFADVMVEGDQHWNHERFVANAVARALKEQAARKPWYFISHDRNGQFSTRASKTVPEGKCLFGDANHPIPVVSKALYKLGEEDPTVGCVICRGDGIHHAVALRHSCEPNMQFVHGRTLLFAAKRQISVGEELTVDYATLRDESMPHFVCSCGTQNCRSVIFPMPATPRTVEGKAMKRLLREKRQVWLKEKADREAERILKKRSSPSSSSSTASSSSNSGSGSSGSTSSSSSSPGSGSNHK